jgi:hypothetical protein
MSWDDHDLGSGGVVLVPSKTAVQPPQIAVAGGKTNVIYVMNPGELSQGYFPDKRSPPDESLPPAQGEDKIVQAYDVGTKKPQITGILPHDDANNPQHHNWPMNHIHGTPAYYQDSKSNQYLYVWPEEMNMQRLSVYATPTVPLAFDEESAITEPENKPGGAKVCQGVS